eukprot:CAMPEP_0117742502 /NCGR_PEP_ID=MMETSP0947-20121206/5585_1 /TAXON_ID=44440 /ORGANISM="Chattonella subsalsa, Strain CCMP2191" /LENGTH=297 /DNA_ID=CAMNT_0005559039 /DNA_START=197 /DNA_END=1090 /DNA_ORIENTATION=-
MNFEDEKDLEFISILDNLSEYLSDSNESGEESDECWEDLEEYEKRGTKYLSRNFIFWNTMVECRESLWSLVRDENYPKQKSVDKALEWLESLKNFLQKSPDQIHSVSVRESFAEFIVYICPHLEGSKKKSRKINRVAKFVFRNILEIEESKISIDMPKLPDHQIDGASLASSSLYDGGAVVFSTLRNKDDLSSPFTVAEEVGCSKPQNEDFDNDVSDMMEAKMNIGGSDVDEERNAAENYDEEVYGLLISMVDEVLDRCLEGAKYGPYTILKGDFKFFIPCSWFPEDFPESGRGMVW